MFIAAASSDRVSKGRPKTAQPQRNAYIGRVLIESLHKRVAKKPSIDTIAEDHS